MEPPQRLFVSKEKKNSISCAVFINMEGGVFVKLLTGSKVPATSSLHGELPSTQYTNKHGTVASRMTSEEYEACVKEAIEYFSPHKVGSLAFKRWVAGRLLVHDRSTCHSNQPIQIDSEGTVLKVAVAPPRSPDLMPLDYSIFGTAKNAVLRDAKMMRSRATRAEGFVAKLRNADVTKSIKAFPQRLLYCKEGGGRRADRRK